MYWLKQQISFTKADNVCKGCKCKDMHNKFSSDAANGLHVGCGSQQTGMMAVRMKLYMSQRIRIRPGCNRDNYHSDYNTYEALPDTEPAVAAANFKRFMDSTFQL